MKPFLDFFAEGIKAITNLPIRILIAEILLVSTQERRKGFLARFLPCLAIIFVWPYVIGMQPEWLMIGEWISLSNILVYALCLFTIGFCYKIDFYQVLFFGAVAGAMEHFYDASQRLLHITLFSGIDYTIWRWIRLLLLILIYSGLYVLFARHLKKEMNDTSKSGYVVVVYLFAIIIIYGTSMYTQDSYDPIYKLYEMISCFLLMFAIYMIHNWQSLNVQNEMIKMLLSQEKKQYQMLKDNNELFDYKYHDIKQILASIKHNSAAENALSSTKELVESYESLVESNNPTLNIILGEKKFVCQRNQIDFTYIIDGSELSFMDEADMYSLFGNAMDNAIERLLKEPEERRVVSLRVMNKVGFIVISIENYCSESPLFENGIPKTTKDTGEFHGFGIKSILHVVKKYGGEAFISVEDECFSLKIIFPIN